MVKYTESNEFREIADKKFGDDVKNNKFDGYMKFVNETNEKEDKIKSAIDVLQDSYDSGMVQKILANVLIRNHRTHQQLIIKNLHGALKLYAEFSGSDARNEEAVKWAKNATKEEVYFPMI